MASGNISEAVLYMELHVLLAYLTSPSSIDAALPCFSKNLEVLNATLEPRSLGHELLHQSRARFLHFHVTHTRSFKPSLLRSALAESISLFPTNTMFLSLYAWNEAKFRIDDRVRSIIADVMFKAPSSKGEITTMSSRRPSVIPYLFAIGTELSRGTILGSNSHTIRSTFEHCVDSDGAKSSVMIWKMYFLWEFQRGEVQKAKAVFYRAVRTCPWAKELYMLAFQFLQDATPWRELKAVYEMMIEKDLRIFVSLDDVFADLEDEEKAARDRLRGAIQ